MSGLLKWLVLTYPRSSCERVSPCVLMMRTRSLRERLQSVKAKTSERNSKRTLKLSVQGEVEETLPSLVENSLTLAMKVLWLRKYYRPRQIGMLA